MATTFSRPRLDSGRCSLACAMVAAAVALAGAGDSCAQSAFEEQYKLIKAPNAVASIGTDLFGDSVNLYNGGLEFVQNDVSIKGNNALPVSVGRRLVAGTGELEERVFGQWDMEIPHLHGVFSSRDGWTEATEADGVPRCTDFGPPKAAIGMNNTAGWTAHEFWQGSFMYIPGVGDQQLLTRAPEYKSAPGPLALFPVVTAKFWSISCLPSLANDFTAEKSMGEGFTAVSPEGTKYQFDWMVSFPALTIRKYAGDLDLTAVPAPGTDSAGTDQALEDPAGTGNLQQLARKEVWILPTLVTDRHGNWVRYTYDPAKPKNLLQIESNDGRKITFTYRTGSVFDTVETVSDQTRTWRYEYAERRPRVTDLTRVILPDKSSWQLENTGGMMGRLQTLPDSGSCDVPATLSSNERAGTMVHPSGAIGSFTMTPTTHGRSDVYRQCVTNITALSEYAFTPRYFYTNSLTNKTISGPGLAAMAWNYDYGSAENASWYPCNGCITTKTVRVTNPKGEVSSYTFGNRHAQTEGKLEEVNVDGVRITRTRYRPSGAGPYPTNVGSADMANVGDADLLARLTPVDQRVIVQQGVQFVWTANSFDTHARPESVTRASSLGHSRTDTSKYEDDLNKWVLGQLVSVTENRTSKEIVRNKYDAATLNLEQVTRFGKVEKTMTYNADGTLASRRDGLDQRTRYEDYNRGIPQLVTYPDGSAERAVVNNIGTIDFLTNGAGFTTAFGYDQMGRLGSIAHPADDSVAWNGTAITFAQSAGSHLDLGAGHWQRHISTGSANIVDYYDALWQPVYTQQWDSADPAGTQRITKRRFDFAGRTTYESYPKRGFEQIGDGLHHEYDALGRPTVTGTISELGILYSGNTYLDRFVTDFTDARGHSTLTSYQVFDEPSESAIASISAPRGVSVEIKRDIFGKPTSVTRSGDGKSVTRSYVYDANERLCKTIEPETGATVQNYDGANNLWWRASGLALPSLNSCDTDSVAAAKKIIYGYDTLNRLLTTTYSDKSPGIGRTYTPDGLPLTISSGGTTWTYKYNRRRLLETESLAYLGSSYELKRDYDENGSLKQLTYPDNITVAYKPNALGEPSQAGEYAKNVTYHPNGAIASFSYGNGITHTLAQNLRGLPERSLDAGVLNDLYAYDQNGNVTSILDWHEGVSNRAMEYDQLGRLTRTFAPAMWGDARYGYDALDNLTDIRIERGAKARTTVHTFDPATNQLKGITGPAGYNFVYDYDGQGNVKQRGAQTYAFDMGNRLKVATGRATYLYDGWGRRASVVGTDGLNRLYVYNQNGKLMYSGPTSGSKSKYIYLGNHMIAEDGVGGIEYIHTDGLGSPVARTSGNGVVLSRTRYEPYGLTAMGEEPSIGFTGHVNDFATGLVYMQQRYYDPIAGRMLSVDPVTTDANTGSSFNRYAYANNSPYQYVDPDGREAHEITPNCMPGLCTTVGAPSRAATGSGPAISSTTGGSNAAQTNGSQQSTGYEQGGQYEMNVMGDFVNPNAPGVGIGQVVAGGTLIVGIGVVSGSAAAGALTRAAVDPKLMARLAVQMEKDGAKSIFKSLRSLENRLAEHVEKMGGLKYRSSVEREIRTFEKQVQTIKRFIKDNGL